MHKYVDGGRMKTIKTHWKTGGDLTAKHLKMEQNKKRLEGWKDKVVHGQQLRQAEQFASA